jgi:aminodeoxyfutalosine deaminase
LLLKIARRNDVALPATTEHELRELYEFRDFRHFIAVYASVVRALRTEEDFRDVVLDYAEQAVAQGAVYMEAIFGPTNSAREGVPWDAIFSGYCEGAAEASEKLGITVLLTPDIGREFSMEEAELTLHYALKHRDRGVVGIGLGGLEADYPPELFESLFSRARAEGLASVPHAGEAAGPESVRGALEALGADRIRHGIRAVEDVSLVEELRDRRIVLDVCPISNLRTGVVKDLSQHPLPDLVRAGVPCSLSTDDPAMFDTDLVREYDAAISLGLDARAFYDAGVHGALCSRAEKQRLRAIRDSYAWSG